MTDWVAQDDWSQVKIGDTVRAMRAEQMLTGVVVDRFCMNGATEPYSLALRVDRVDGALRIGRSGWQLSVPAKPAVELPTEPGVYLDVDNEVWRLSVFKEWVYLEGHHEDPKQFAPLTKLEPVAVTAKKVLTMYREGISSLDIEKHFGVTA